MRLSTNPTNYFLYEPACNFQLAWDMSVEIDSDPPIWDMFVHFAKVEAFPESIVELLIRFKNQKQKTKQNKILIISSQHFNLSRSQLFKD